MAATSNYKAIHFGAVNISRGFVACFLHNSGYHVVFADVADTLVDALNASPSYRVIEVGVHGTSVSTIKGYRAINSKTHEADLVTEISTADVVTCSVGPHALGFIAPIIAKGIDRRLTGSRRPLSVIACENAVGATDILAKFIKSPENTPADRLKDHSSRARYANSAIDRNIPSQNPNSGLDVTLESYFEWVVENVSFRDISVPKITGITWVDNLAPFIERKLFTVNTSHATAAYYGFHRSKRTIYHAIQDEYILAKVRGVLDETKRLLIIKHGIDEETQNTYIDSIIERISNPHLQDTITRVGRAPLRKLSRDERFVGPAAEIAKTGGTIRCLLSAVEMALRFRNEDDGRG